MHGDQMAETTSGRPTAGAAGTVADPAPAGPGTGAGPAPADQAAPGTGVGPAPAAPAGAAEPRLAGVRLRVGVRHAVVPGALDRAFGLVADGALPPDAPVEMVVTPATVACRACGGYGTSAEILAACPSCGAVDVDVSDGDELVLEALRF